MRLVRELDPPPLGPLGLDQSLSEEEQALQAKLSAFADDVLEPRAAALDRMRAEAMVAPGADWWSVFGAFGELGLDVEALYLSDPLRGNRLKSIAFEELGRGDAGLAIGLMVAYFPYVMCRLLDRPDLAGAAEGKVGCWIATQEVRGSDAGDVEGKLMARGSRHEAPQMHARLDGDAVVLNGHSSPWVSLGPVAQVALGYFPLLTDGEPDYDEDGTLRGVGVFVPLDAPGVTKGVPLDKLGQRTLPQGAIHFDGVRLPMDHVVATPEDYRASFASALVEGNQTLAAVFTGLARRSLEHGLAYAAERRQGGAPITDHQLVRHRLFAAFRSVEAMRAVTRLAFDRNGRGEGPQLLASVTAKTFVTEAAIEVTADCLRFFGGRGLSRGYPMEKLLRDVRASVTEDGDNHILGLVAADHLLRARGEARENASYAERYPLV